MHLLIEKGFYFACSKVYQGNEPEDIAAHPELGCALGPYTSFENAGPEFIDPKLLPIRTIHKARCQICGTPQFWGIQAPVFMSASFYKLTKETPLDELCATLMLEPASYNLDACHLVSAAWSEEGHSGRLCPRVVLHMGH